MNAQMTLAEIEAQKTILLEIAEELDPDDQQSIQVFEEQLQALVLAGGVKVDGIVYFLKELESQSAFQQELADLHAQAAKRLTLRMNACKTYFAELYAAGVLPKRLPGVSTEIRFQRNAQPSINIALTEDEIREQWIGDPQMGAFVEIKTVERVVVDKQGIAVIWKENPEAFEGTPGLSVRQGYHTRTGTRTV